MKNVWKKTLVVFILLLAIVIGISLLLPEKMTIARSIQINAPVEFVFGEVNELKNWEEWSPWSELDSQIVFRYNDVHQGEGASYCWEGSNELVGKGCVTILSSEKNELITTELDFTDAGRGMATGSWLFEAIQRDLEDETHKDAVIITWTMEVDMTFVPIVGKFMGSLMEDRLGSLFEQGLQRLKTYVEKAEQEQSPVVIVELSEQLVLAIKDSCSIDDIGDKMGELFTELNNFLEQHALEYAGPPITRYHRWDPDENFTVLEAAVPVFENSITAEGRMQYVTIPGGDMAYASHYGTFSTSDLTHQLITSWLEENGHPSTGIHWEVYVTDPREELDTNRWETKIYYPIENKEAPAI